MAEEIDEDALARVEAKIERDNVGEMSADEWNAWLDTLTEAEFLAMAVRFGIAPTVQ